MAIIEKIELVAVWILVPLLFVALWFAYQHLKESTRRRIYWGGRYLLAAMVRHRRIIGRSIILGYAFALVVSIVQPRLYRAESKIYVSGMCPHGILVGEPRQMISFGHVSVGTTSCAECSMGAESGGNAATK